MRRVTLLALAALVLAGCGDSKHAAATTTGRTVEGTRVARVIRVRETEYRLTPSQIDIQRFGTYAIRAVNDGKLTHALAITGHGVTSQTGNIAPGKSATLLVSLKKAGTYTLFCPIDGHARKGMTATVRVRRS